VTVDEAEDGAEAIRMVQQQPYDLVLMDILMPVMGGLEAARYLRNQAQFASLPIVAMTGNSTEEDRVECLAAGMDDVLVKPIDFDELPQQMRRWLARGEVDCRSGEMPEASPPMQEGKSRVEATFSLPSLAPVVDDEDRDRAVRILGGNLALYSQLMRYFPVEHGDTPAKIRQAVARHDLAEGERLAHSLKSSAASLGAGRLMEISAQVEQQLRAGAVPHSQTLQMMTDACEELVQLLGNTHVSALSSQQQLTNMVSVMEIEQQLEQLAEALRRGEERAISMLEELLPSLQLLGKEEAAQLQQLVDGFDFVAAAALLQQMSDRARSGEA